MVNVAHAVGTRPTRVGPCPKAGRVATTSRVEGLGTESQRHGRRIKSREDVS